VRGVGAKVEVEVIFVLNKIMYRTGGRLNMVWISCQERNLVAASMFRSLLAMPLLTPSGGLRSPDASPRNNQRIPRPSCPSMPRPGFEEGSVPQTSIHHTTTVVLA
jgi:hypothetical protein